MAEAFPHATWRGYDTSAVALARAAQNLAASGVANVSFHDPRRDPMPVDHSADLVTMFDVAHDLADPLGALRAAHAALQEDGTLAVSEIAQPEALAEKLAHPAAPMLYGFSLGICLQCGLSEPGGAGLGALGLSEAVLRDLGTRAGFTRFRRTDVADPFNAYYELRP
jgi:SAM-dependent methyltransferase